MTTQLNQEAKTKPPRIGAHVSAAGGIHKAIERAAAIGCNCLQVFSASPRSWRRPDIEAIASKQIVSERIQPLQRELHISLIVTHSMYLVNLASPKPEQLEKSRQVLEFDLEFDARVSGGGVVVHPGSHLGKGWEAVKEQVAEQIALILKNSSEEATLLLENSAGQNGKLCSDLAEIRWLLDQINSPRLGWCVDTCHAFAAGYALGENTPKISQEATKKIKPENIRSKTLLQEITTYNLWKELQVVHVNDSRDPFASGRDRHANIGEGEFLLQDLAFFLRDSNIRQKPLILEVPGQEGNGPDAINIDRIKNI